jgi:hypothetical protein
MSYIGNQSQTAYSAMVKQDITGNGGTSYTLSHPVSNENDILLYINNVKQEGGSGKAFTASGTTLTLSEAIANTDSCYVQYIGLAIQTVVPPDGSVSTAKIASSAVDLTSKVTGVLPVANGGTGIVSNPMFKVTGVQNIALTNNTFTKVTFNSEVFDVGGYYDSTTNYRYTPQVAGKYFIYGRAYMTYASDAIENMYVAIYKNGTEVSNFATSTAGANYGSVQVSSLIEMNGSSDYVEIYIKASNTSDATYYAAGSLGEFSGYRIGA